MPLLAASHVSHHYAGPLLLEDVTVTVEPGDRIGVIGRNGSGKSTLLEILAGRLEPTGGAVIRQKGTTVDYQAQELEYTPGATVYQEMQAVLGAGRDLEERLAQDPSLLDHIGIFDVDRRIATMLSSLGLPEESWHRPVEDFSGGERNVIGLARVLLEEPDVMLLDEPSNHLDMDGVEWFIGFLQRTRAAVVMVSHNRHLLDATMSGIWELRRRTVTGWTGNYSDFQRQKAEALLRQERQYKVQQRLIERIEFQARRLMDMANAYDDPAQAKRAIAMRRRIERMDRVERPQEGGKRFRASLQGASRHGRIALQVRGFDFAYGDRVLFDNAELEVEYGDRVCLVGPNGSGKTTLMSHILADGGWEHPTLRLGKSVKVGEYRQLHDALDHDAALIDWAMRVTGRSRSAAADLLHRFLFARDDLERRIGTLSGGEKSRLQLARLVHEQVNFLLLDEPTNHLDIEACEQLEEMLRDFEGTLLIISHDRYFLDRLVNRVVEVRNLALELHRCPFAEWWQERRALGRKSALLDRRPKADKTEARKEFEQRKQRQRELSRLRARHRALEERIEGLEARQSELKRRLEEVYSKGAHDRDLGRDFDAVREELGEAYREWESVGAAIEASER